MILTIKSDQITPSLKEVADDLTGAEKRVIMLKMAQKFRQITLRNFGPSGIDRPTPWQLLRQKYAKSKANRTVNLRHSQISADRIPTLIKTNKLINSIRAECDNNAYSEVSSDVDYAPAQQFGDSSKHLPPRPFMPFINGQLTPYAENELISVAENELVKILTS